MLISLLVIPVQSTKLDQSRLLISQSIFIGFAVSYALMKGYNTLAH
jgi:hypothetical protein